MKFLNSIRASMLLGKGHKYLQKGRYKEALDKALKAQNLELEEQFEWLSYSIEGKSRFHLGDLDNALVSLHKAERILSSKLEKEQASEHLQNIIAEIKKYIDKIEQGAI